MPFGFSLVEEHTVDEQHFDGVLRDASCVSSDLFGEKCRLMVEAQSMKDQSIGTCDATVGIKSTGISTIDEGAPL